MPRDGGVFGQGDGLVDARAGTAPAWPRSGAECVADGQVGDGGCHLGEELVGGAFPDDGQELHHGVVRGEGAVPAGPG